MKRKSWMPQLLGAAFAFTLSVSAVGNLATGFDLDVAVMEILFLWCAVFSLVSALLYRYRYGGIALFGLSLLAAPLFWKEGLLWDQFQSLAYRISHHYHIVYRWPVLGEPAADDVSLPLIVLGAWAAFSVTRSFCRGKSILPVIPPVILPLVLCLVTTDTVPDGIYLYLVMAGMALLLLTGWTRRNCADQGIRLTLRMAVPVAAAIALLFFANPRESYVNHGERYQKEALAWFQQMQGAFLGNAGVPGTSQKLNLEAVGPKGRSGRAVMRVNAPVDGTIYLRGRDYDVYTGAGWESSGDREEVFISGGSSAGELRILTYGVRDVLYVPYYTAQEITMTGGALDNDENLRQYSYDYSLAAYGTYAIDSHYTDLPADTRRWANTLDVIQAAASAFPGERVRLIEEYVQNAAVYDLSTPRMSPAYGDFAQWFLEESDTGYCVHFATTATVLLRAAGIPARYVEGYMVNAQAGTDVVVLGRHAHAWAEYYSEGVWRILEATPPDFSMEEETDPIQEETEPDPSEPPTVPPADDTTPGPETQPLDPGNPGNTPGQTMKKPFELPGWTRTVFWVMLAAALTPAQSKLRAAWKRKQWNRGKPNEKTVTRWRQTKTAARLVKASYPKALEALAQKAVFSQHRIRDDELRLFDEYREDLTAAVRGKPWYWRILLRWVFAIE